MKDCSSIKRDQTRSFLYNTLPAMCREGGGHDVKRRTVQENVSISCCTAKSCTAAELEL